MNIHVNEPTTDMFEKYLSSSIFVLTSIYEPFGLVMPEAMSCGVPVVAFDCPSGPAEIIDNEKTGYLVLNRDKNTFAERLDQLMNSRELRERLGKAAIESSMRFAPEKIMPIWKDLFEKLIASAH
jgi:glycosyltransferase involved in cell wall biosynthesis